MEVPPARLAPHPRPARLAAAAWWRATRYFAPSQPERAHGARAVQPVARSAPIRPVPWPAAEAAQLREMLWPPAGWLLQSPKAAEALLPPVKPLRQAGWRSQSRLPEVAEAAQYRARTGRVRPAATMGRAAARPPRDIAHGPGRQPDHWWSRSTAPCSEAAEPAERMQDWDKVGSAQAAPHGAGRSLRPRSDGTHS